MGTRGPAPDPNAIRRDRPSDQATWTTLPEKREGPAPDWPFEDGMSGREAALWNALWSLPQAVVWERDQRVIEVALHVETLVDAAYGYLVQGKGKDEDKVFFGPPAPMRALVLKQQESLGLTAAAMGRLRWRIADTAPVRKEARTRDARRASDKARFQVIEGEAAKAS